MMRSLSMAFGVVTVVALAACPVKMAGQTSSPSAPQEAKTGSTLAKIGPTVITTEEFSAKINQQSPFIRSRYTDIEKRREYLENQIRFELLAQEAERRGIDKAEDVRDSLKKIMVQKLTRDEFDNRVKLDDIGDAEIQTYYDAHQEDYHKPEMVRVSHIYFPFGSDQPAAKKQAQTVLRELKTRADDRLAFRALAKAHSADDETKNAGGDLRYLARAQYTEKYGSAVAETVFGLEKLNALSGLVDGKDGFHIFKQTGRRQAIDRSIDQVRTQIRNRLYRDRRTEAFNSFVDTLRAQAGVSIDEAKLAAIEVAGSATPVGGNSPLHGGPRAKPAAAVAAPQPPAAAAPGPAAAQPAKPAPAEQH